MESYPILGFFEFKGIDRREENLEILYRTLGQYDKAKKEAEAGLEYAQSINNNNAQRWYNDSLAYHDFEAGNFDGVLERAEFIRKSAVEDELPAWQISALGWKILAHLRQDNIEEALVITEEVKKIVDGTLNTRDIRGYWDDLGLIEMKKKNYPEAIELFAQVYKMQGGQRSWNDPHAYILNNLASAYYQYEDLEAAKKEYENILSLTTGRLRQGDLYAKSFYMLGKICEQQGDTAKAIENYEKFLDLWKDADPGIAEVEDARKRLARLGNN